jgi:hypothetical protein
LVHSGAFFSTLVALIYIVRLSELEKDLEILLLPQQVSILLRMRDKSVCPTLAEKLTLAVLTAKLKEKKQSHCKSVA